MAGTPAADPVPEPSTTVSTQDDQEFLLEQKNRALVRNHIKLAKEFMERLEYERAKRELIKALELDATNIEARKLLDQVGELLGERPASVRTLLDEMATAEAVRAEQARLEAEELFSDAMTAMSNERYGDAIRDLERVQLTMQYSPAAVDWADLKERTDQRLQEARAAQSEYEADERERRQREIYERLQGEEREERRIRAARIDRLLVDAIDKFELQQYDASMKLADQVLEIDPDNRQARELYDSAQKAYHRKVTQDYLRERARRFKAWKQDIAETKIPYSDVLRWADRDYWEEITRKRRDASGVYLEDADDGTTRELRNRLESEMISRVEFEDDDLESVVNFLQASTGISFIIDPEVLDQYETDGTPIQGVSLSNMTAENVLNWVIQYAGEGVTYTFLHGTVYITTQEKASKGRSIVVLHDIRDLTIGLTDFNGPKLEEIKLPGSGFEEEESSVFGTAGETIPAIAPEDLLELVQENVGLASWDIPGNSIDISAGQLLVVNSPAVQREVQQFLDDLRRFSGVVVTIESRFVTVTDAFLQEIGVDFRGLGGESGTLSNLDDVTNGLEDNASRAFDNTGPGPLLGAGGNPSSGIFFNDGEDGDVRGRTENIFDEALGGILSNSGGGSFQFAILDDTEFNIVLRMVEKTLKSNVVTAPTLTVYNAQRAYVTMINQVSYIQDFDVEVAQTSFIADPQIGVIPDGIVLDVRPTVSADRKYITLEVQTTVASLTRPIPTFSTTLGGTTGSVTIQLPEVRVSNAATTVRVPDGGSLILGGLKTISSVERRSEIPWFSNIPILSFLLGRRGKSEEVENLMILIKAYITDVREMEPTFIEEN
ncbi:MAG: hypothetical protein RL885_18180 [Planctomycetota bacterium]